MYYIPNKFLQTSFCMKMCASEESVAIPTDRFRSIFAFRFDGCRNFCRISERAECIRPTFVNKGGKRVTETAREQELDAEGLCSGIGSEIRFRNCLPPIVFPV
ncbi:hypothetical protein CEXT_169541 [Caerostris extrusa]|uniref:Uncharacterized protein n=1 Tax=Caerostris extrusa TaxID=172846 RepID=A0AAV4XHZ0_CAEEX|nr:hypothetical protein CEXT_169541 [Caerostris extrusa]